MRASSGSSRPSGCSGGPASARAGRGGGAREQGLAGAVDSLLNPGAEQLVGPAPHDDNGQPLEPDDVWGDDHCWWLDRMVRTTRPLDRADDAHLARLVRDLERGRRLPAADARTRTSSSAATRSARSTSSCHGVTERPGDAALAERRPERQGGAERELRPRDDGAASRSAPTAAPTPRTTSARRRAR